MSAIRRSWSRDRGLADAAGGIRLYGADRRGGHHPDQYVLDPRQCRTAHLGPPGRDEGPSPPTPGSDCGNPGLHGRTAARETARRTFGGGCRGGSGCLSGPSAPGSRGRGGRQGGERPPLDGGDLRRGGSRAPGPQRRERLCGDHAGLQQLLLLLRGALHAGPRTEPRGLDDRCRGTEPLRQRLPGGDAPGPERQLTRRT